MFPEFVACVVLELSRRNANNLRFAFASRDGPTLTRAWPTTQPASALRRPAWRSSAPHKRSRQPARASARASAPAQRQARPQLCTRPQQTRTPQCWRCCSTRQTGASWCVRVTQRQAAHLCTVLPRQRQCCFLCVLERRWQPPIDLVAQRFTRRWSALHPQ